MNKILIPGFLTVSLVIVLGMTALHQTTAVAILHQQNGGVPELFKTSVVCMSCHNGLVSPSGEDISIGVDWRASMMANASRDPYWQAGVRREITDHPGAKAEIENECSTCHMPMATFQAHANGRKGEVFARLPVGKLIATKDDVLAADGVSCTLCHQITGENFGKKESFTGGFVVDSQAPMGQRKVFGPYDIDPGRVTLMRSASEMVQEKSTHIQESEHCATCHTLYTHSLSPTGEVIGELPEQVPYLEWRHSAYVREKSCQSCHMPVVEDSVAISSVLGPRRLDFSRHSFRGGNFFMVRMLNRYRDELGVMALPLEMDATANRTLEHLKSNTARLSIADARCSNDQLLAEVEIENLAGHKLPTAYPSRRAWIHFTVQDQNGRVIFESGAFDLSGQIIGNDNDIDPDRYESHYDVINRSDQVQIYESIMADPQGRVTTGLLTAVRFVKDNRLLPRGFDKTTAPEDIAVHGEATRDLDFSEGKDRVHFQVDTAGANGPFVVKAELWYQPIAYRWAENLKSYDTPETNRFVKYYDSMRATSAQILATKSVEVR